MFVANERRFSSATLKNLENRGNNWYRAERNLYRKQKMGEVENILRGSVVEPNRLVRGRSRGKTFKYRMRVYRQTSTRSNQR